ncbi:MAG: hypothetical protein KDJ52_14235 [Anaerolineae bacterium]|nr:hypothetical protein [Anaerolineae bacterium]
MADLSEQTSVPEVEKAPVEQSVISEPAERLLASTPDAPFPNPSETSPISPITSTDRRPFFYVGIGLVILLLAAVVGMIFLYAIYALFLTGDSGEETVVAEVEAIITEEAVATPVPTATPTTDPGVDRSLNQQVREVPTVAAATVVPAPPPSTRPQLLANSSIDFSSSQGTWNYLWTFPGSNTWEPMVYESRDYGTCWYATDYVRICQESGHPGNSADIGWRWTSPVTGPIEILIRAEKIDVGGDGVIISVFNNTLDASTKPVFSRPLLGDDSSGFANRFIIDTIQPGEFLLFVMEKNEDVTFDHTNFEVTICQISCP